MVRAVSSCSGTDIVSTRTHLALKWLTFCMHRVPLPGCFSRQNRSSCHPLTLANIGTLSLTTGLKRTWPRAACCEHHSRRRLLRTRAAAIDASCEVLRTGGVLPRSRRRGRWRRATASSQQQRASGGGQLHSLTQRRGLSGRPFDWGLSWGLSGSATCANSRLCDPRAPRPQGRRNVALAAVLLRAVTGRAVVFRG